MKRLCAAFVVAVITCTSALGQVGTTAVVFQQIVTDPEARALGEATVGYRGHLAGADLNPATIGRAGLIQAGSNLSGEDGFRTPWLRKFGAGLWVASPYVDVKMNRWAAAYQYKHLFLGRREARDEQNNRIGTFDTYDYTHKLSVAYDVRPNFSVGLGINLIRSHAGPRASAGASNLKTASAQSVDVGILYDRAFKISGADLLVGVGWSLTDFGSAIVYSGMSYPLPTRMRGGISLTARSTTLIFERPTVSAGLHLALSKLMVRSEWQEDGTLKHDSPFRSLFTSWQAMDTREGSTLSLGEQLVRHAGASVSMLEIVHLRVGRFHEHEENGARQYTSLGWGVDLYYVRLDHSWISNVGETQPLKGTNFWRLTARVPLEDSDANFWKQIIR